MSPLTELITAIHAHPMKLVYEFTGAGAQALTWLHSVGGSSRTILAAHDHYATTALIERLGFEPPQFTSAQVAQTLATQAFFAASRLAPRLSPVMGVGCTATIATDRLKWGDHRAVITVCTATTLTTYRLTMPKGARSREQEESLVSQLVIQAITHACNLPAQPLADLIPADQLSHETQHISLIDRLRLGEIEWLAVSPDGQLTTAPTLSNITLLSGSFNPLHDGHRQLAEAAASMVNQAVYFELPLINADKPPLDQAETERRLRQFVGYAPVLLTRAPLFSQKATLFPKSSFILGLDTAIRLLQPRFYHEDPAQMYEALHHIQQSGGHFLVAGRKVDETHLTLADLTIPPQYQTLFTEIPASRFRLDISSTALRQVQ